MALTERIVASINGREGFAYGVFLNLAANDCEWHSDPNLPGAEIHSGREAVASFLSEFGKQWTDFQLESVEIIDAGEARTLLLARLRAKGRASGVTSDQPVAYLVTFRAEEIVRTQAFFDHASGRSAAGLT